MDFRLRDPTTDDRPKLPAPVLSYRSPDTDPSAPSAADILKGALAICMGIIFLIGTAGLTIGLIIAIPTMFSDEYDREWVVFMLPLAVACAFGVWVSYRCVRDYLSGQNRRRRALLRLRPADDSDQERQV